MSVADRVEPEGGADGERQAASAPIVIIQRSGASWGREVLLLLLLLSAGGYIAFREYRGPSLIVRAEPIPGGRIVDSVPVAPVAAGEIRLRVGGHDPAAGSGEAPLGVEPTRGAASADREAGVMTDPGHRSLEFGPPSEPVAPEPPPGIDREPIAEPTPARDGDDDATEVAGAKPDRIAGGGPLEDEAALQADAAPIEPTRNARSEILWDPERQEGPPPELPMREPPDELGIDALTDVGREDPLPPAFQPPTFEQRRHFLQCLALAIRQNGRRAGPQLEGLCRDFEMGMPPELLVLGQRLGPNFVLPGSDLDRTIASLRRIGVPEPYLLDRISDLMNRTIGARHGPRDRMEARVFAARRLLAVPLEVAADARN